MVLATAQHNTAVSVKAGAPGSGSFAIRLTGNAPTGGLKVAYFVLNKVLSGAGARHGGARYGKAWLGSIVQ